MGPTPHDLSVAELNILYAVVDTYLTEVEWVPIVQLRNRTDSTICYPLSITTRYVLRNGGNAEALVGLASVMQDLCLRFENVHKAFTAQEIVPTTIDIKLDILPGQYIVVYQKRWRFEHNLWFISKLAVEEKMVTVGNPTQSRYAVKEKGVVVEERIERNMSSFVDSNEYFVDKSASVTANTVREVQVESVQEVYMQDIKKDSIRHISQGQQNMIIKLLA